MVDKNTTIRVKESTKEKLIDLDFAKKDMSFDQIILELVERNRKEK